MSMIPQLIHPLRQLATHPADALRALIQDSRSSFWALADQGITSMGNFTMSIVLAREFAFQHRLGDYGMFWMLMELMVFLNGIQSAWLIYPISVRGALLPTPGLLRMVSHSLLFTSLIWPLLLLGLAVTSVVARIPIGVALWAALALALWQFQETTRRALMAHLRFRDAAVGDAISYLGQTLAMAALASLGVLTLQRTFQAMACTSALAWLLQSAQLGLSPPGLGDAAAFAREAWLTGRWVLYGNLTNLFSGVMFNWNFAYWAGPEALGIYYGLLNVVRLVNPVAFAIATLITPNAARALQQRGMPYARAISARFAFLGAALLTPYLGLVALFPTKTLAFLYGERSPYIQHASLLQLCVIAVGLVYAAVASGAFLNAVQRSKQAFLGQIMYAAGYLVLVMPLTAAFGIAGAIYGWLTVATILTLSNLHFATASLEIRNLGGVAMAPST